MHDDWCALNSRLHFDWLATRCRLARGEEARCNERDRPTKLMAHVATLVGGGQRVFHEHDYKM